ncbi:probable serine/threonine-protein kinase DDB_G0272282 isoform X2 [Hydra vulgaris]|uniref:Probable serine/threonine-protein kinase DDB_G0272282 isoform X2 n=1 Tax=Hydra vulgaris TaxID=6087 RepID=A0ABM4CUX0_HYDVU
MPIALAENVLTLQNKTNLNFTQKNNSIDRNEKERESKTESRFNENTKSIDNALNEIINEEALDALNHFVDNFLGDEKNVHSKNDESDIIAKKDNQTTLRNNLNNKSFERQNDTQIEKKPENQVESMFNNNTNKSVNDTASPSGREKNIDNDEENSFNKQVINEVIHKLFLAKNDEDKLEKLLKKDDKPDEPKNESTIAKVSLDTLKKSDLAKHNESSFEEIVEKSNRETDLNSNAKLYGKKRYTPNQSNVKPPQTFQKPKQINVRAQEKLITFVQRYQNYMNNFYKRVHEITHNPEFWKNVSREYNAESSLKRYLVFGKYKPGPLVRAFLKLSPNYKNVLQNAIEESSDPKVQNLLKLSNSYKSVLRAAIKRWSCYISGRKTVTGSKKDKMIVNEDTDIADEFVTKVTNDPTKTFLLHLLDDTANPNIEAKPIHHYSQKTSFPNGWTDNNKISVLNQSTLFQTNDLEKLEQFKMEGPIYIESGNRKRLIPSSGMEYTEQNNLDIADFTNSESSFVNEDEESNNNDVTWNSKSKTKLMEFNQDKIERKQGSNKKSISQNLKPAAVHVYENKEELTGNNQYSLIHADHDTNNLINADHDTNNLINADQNAQQFNQNNFKKYEEHTTKESRDEQVVGDKISDSQLFENKHIGNVMNASGDIYAGEDNEKVLTDIESAKQIKEPKRGSEIKPETNEENLISDGISLLMSNDKTDGDKAYLTEKKIIGNVIKTEPLQSYDLSSTNQNNDEISYYENQLKQIKKEKEKEYIDGLSKRVAMPKVVNSTSLQDVSLNPSGFNILKLIGRSQTISLPDGFRTSWIRNNTKKEGTKKGGTNKLLPQTKDNTSNGVVKVDNNKNLTNALEVNNSYDKFYNTMENLERDLPIETETNTELASDEMKEDVRSLSNSLQYYGENETLLSELTKPPNSVTKKENSEGSNSNKTSFNKNELSNESRKQSHKPFDKKHSGGKIFDSNDRDSVNGTKKTIAKKKMKSF